jgi:cysteine desulfurase
MLYFDHNATTPLDQRVLDAMLPYMTSLYGNASSLYRFGRIARSAIETAREQLAALTDALPEQIIFTSGGTEADALALANAGTGSAFISAIEHPAVFENTLARQNPVTMLEVEPTGCIDITKLNHYQIKSGDFVSVMLANNETGAIQDLAGIADCLKGRGVTLHTDAVQALGKMPVSFKKLGVQLMSVSSHKIYGPKGCGALIFDPELNLQPLQRGGDQERGLRAGTENVAAIVGFGKAAELAKTELAERIAKLLTLRERLEQQLITIPDLVIFAQAAPRLPNTTQFGIPGIRGDMLLMQLDRKNIAVSSGSACSAGSGETSPVLKAMGVAPALANSAIRLSLGKDNNEQEVDNFVQRLKSILAIH